MMVEAVAASSAADSFAEDAAQAHAHPAVQVGERRAPTVFEVFKPAAQRAVHVRDDRLQALAVGPFCLPANGVLELRQALLPRKAAMLEEAITKELEALSVHVDDFMLDR